MFAASYEEARAAFREATRGLPSGALEVQPGYTIDWAWSGPRDARDVVVFSSGLHGVEGYAGSAAQRTLLAEADDTPVLWLHALNPWGMAHLRRVNESNVDLNRNFLPPGAPYTSDDPTFAAVDPLLNPPTAGGFELFWIHVGWIVLRHGYQTLKNAIVGGQHQNPRGMFYGGAGLEATGRVLLPFLDGELAGRRRVVHVDLHTGLGAYGERTLLLEGETTPAQVARARAAFGPDVKAWDATNKDAYEIRGGMLRELQRRLPQVRFDGLTCELGTLPNLPALVALRNENRVHHWGGPEGQAPEHPAKRALLEAFVPQDPAWRARVGPHARALHAAARTLLAQD